MPDCTLSGTVNGAVVNLKDCTPQPGAVLRFTESETSMPGPNEGLVPTVPVAAPAPEGASAVPASAPEAAPAAPAATTAPAATELVAITESHGADASVGAAADAASKLGGDYAPIVAIVLAGVAVLGGKKAWDFYSERSQQKHDLAVKELELKAQAQGLNGAQPPPCQAANVKLEAEITEVKTRLAAIEKKTASVSADFDGEDLERQVKKLIKDVKALKEA